MTKDEIILAIKLIRHQMQKGDDRQAYQAITQLILKASQEALKF